MKFEIGGNNYTLLHLESAKPCGECKACCTAIGIVELGKPNYKRCEHLCKSGCAIYNSKPASCTEYQCWYTAGLVDDRPDKIGLIVDFQLSPLPGAIRIWEVWSGASETKRGKALIKKLCEKYDCDVWLATKEWSTNLKTGYVVRTPSAVVLPPTFDQDQVKFDAAMPNVAG